MTKPCLGLRLVAAALGAMALLLAGGCGSATATAPTADAAKRGVGTPMQDARTEANIVEMENEYIAAKNSSPVRQGQADAMAKKKADDQTQAEAEKQAKAPAEPDAETKK